MYSKSTSWESTLSMVALKKELWLNEGVTMENSISVSSNMNGGSLKNKNLFNTVGAHSSFLKQKPFGNP
jgi:hypothetical protein